MSETEQVILTRAEYHSLLLDRAELYEALDDLWSWVRNWDSEFMSDPEFDQALIESALGRMREKP